ncbi:MAG: universal stress protein [Bacteroidales bacterium]|nr:universal stress protein [Bacteroidales bacterium]
MKSFRTNKLILIPTDFSEVAENAIVHGLELARELHYSVCLLHVFNNGDGVNGVDHAAAFQNTQQDLLQRKAKYEQQYGVKTEALIRSGNLFKVINAVVAELKPAFMVMGTHGKQGLQHLFGSHALRVVLDSPCPVIVVQDRSFNQGYRRILIPVNSEVYPIRLIDWALLLGKLFKPEIHLFQALETDTDRNNRIARISHQIADAFLKKKISFTAHVAGSPNDFSEQVVSFANTNKSDLVMTLAIPTTEAIGYNLSEWNERLMFNPYRIPVMFIDRADTTA